jgi:hypothetical protein
MRSRWIAGCDGRWCGRYYPDARLAERIYSPYRDFLLTTLLLDRNLVDVAYSLGAERIICRPPCPPGGTFTFSLATIKKYAQRLRRSYAIDISFAEEANSKECLPSIHMVGG